MEAYSYQLSTMQTACQTASLYNVLLTIKLDNNTAKIYTFKDGCYRFLAMQHTFVNLYSQHYIETT